MGIELSFFEVFILLGLVLFSAFMSCSEVALFSLSRFQLRALKDYNRNHHRRVKQLLTDPAGLLVSILLVNEIINISISTLIARAISHSGEERAASPLFSWLTQNQVPTWIQETALGILITTPILLLLCEATPKVIGTRANEFFAPLISRPLLVIYQILKPVRIALQRGVDLFLNAITGTPLDQLHLERAHESRLKEQEFLLMVEEGQKEGALASSEVELIKNVFDLDDRTVSDIATPLNKVQTIHEHTTVKTALAQLTHHRFSRIPVVAALQRKNVLGVLYAKDLLRAKTDTNLLSQSVTILMRKPLYVGSTLRLHSLFRKMKQQKTHLAVVVGQNTEAFGIVTMNDVLEALLEDVLPEGLGDYEE